MKRTRFIMGMPVRIEIVIKGTKAAKAIAEVFDYFRKIDKQFSPYKKDSEVSQINRGEIAEKMYSLAMKKILRLAEKTKKETNGYFDVYRNGKLDPSGIVKGYAIENGAKILKKKGYKNFYIEIAGDIAVAGNKNGKAWRVGIKNPFKTDEIVKVLSLQNRGIATSGNYLRGQHIYSPKNQSLDSVVSLTVIGPTVFDADRLATAAFAMGKNGIHFIEKLPNFEGYVIDKNGIGTWTSGFERYITN